MVWNSFCSWLLKTQTSGTHWTSCSGHNRGFLLLFFPSHPVRVVGKDSWGPDLNSIPKPAPCFLRHYNPSLSQDNVSSVTLSVVASLLHHTSAGRVLLYCSFHFSETSSVSCCCQSTIQSLDRDLIICLTPFPSVVPLPTCFSSHISLFPPFSQLCQIPSHTGAFLQAVLLCLECSFLQMYTDLFPTSSGHCSSIPSQWSVPKPSFIKA